MQESIRVSVCVCVCVSVCVLAHPDCIEFVIDLHQQIDHIGAGERAGRLRQVGHDPLVMRLGLLFDLHLRFSSGRQRHLIAHHSSTATSTTTDAVHARRAFDDNVGIELLLRQRRRWILDWRRCGARFQIAPQIFDWRRLFQQPLSFGFG